ncbi:Galactofuranosyl transferase GlfT1 [Microbacterium oxydans]|uniref:Galactofuranosyl transferase GlfT1 n=1 Tax=Microbacterium oxydans TaxID=82380 RepID=A0A0F0KU73_9MICO|nr:glycosyltransferase family 2 protein [Microbacterium oxydans]KJL24039.1 Galactofuranosyl transferase GlfT1 [Microbacterium oxydans]
MTKAAPKVAAVVLSYKPDSGIIRNLDELAKQADTVYVVNNSPEDPATADVLGPLSDRESVVVLDQDGNVGVAAGFNAGMRQALADGFDYVWIFDQDSTVSEGMLAALLTAFDRPGAPVAIAGPALRAEETGHLYDGESSSGIRDQVTLISSGALFARAALEEIGLHDERLFIDYVDHDISLRARRSGFRIVKVYDTVLDHRFGASVPSTFLGRRIYLSNYSPMRHYYMTRNRVVMVRRYGLGRWFWEDAAYAAKSWIKVLLCEKDRNRKIGAAVRGFVDGLKLHHASETVSR